MKRAVEYLDRLSADSGSNVQLGRDLAAAYVKLGTVQGSGGQANLGDRAGAAQSFQKAAELLERLHKQRPDDSGITDQLIKAYTNSADMQPDANLALDVNKKAFRIAEMEALRKPDDDRPKRTVALTEFSIAQPLIRMGRYQEAEGWYARSLDIYEDLSRRSPEDLTLRRSVAVMKKRMGAVQAAQRKYVEAQPLYEAAYAIDSDLLKRQPTREHKMDLSFDITDLGYLACQRGDHATELARMDEALPIRQELADDDAHDQRAQIGLASILARKGRALHHLHREAEGIPLMVEGLDMFEKLGEKANPPVVRKEIQEACAALAPAKRAAMAECK